MSFKKMDIPEDIEEIKTTESYHLNYYLEKGWKLFGTIQTSYLREIRGFVTVKRYPMIKTEFVIGRPKGVPEEE